MDTGRWLSNTIAIWEDYSRNVEDESCVSVNLASDYFKMDNYDDDAKMDRNERRFRRYVKKKYDQSRAKGTFKNTMDFDESLGAHPAVAVKDMETILIERK